MTLLVLIKLCNCMVIFKVLIYLNVDDITIKRNTLKFVMKLGAYTNIT